MNIREQKIRLLPIVLALALASLSTTCAAISSMGKAEVTELDELPCFAVQSTAETRKGIPLYSVHVSERQSANWQTLPDEVWSFKVEPPGSWIETTPQECYRYGEAPVSSNGTPAKPLRLYRVYAVDISARAHGSGTVSYGAEFCIKPSGTGKITVQPVPWDETTGQWRYDVCTPKQE